MSSEYLLRTKEAIQPLVTKNGNAWEVYQKDFPVLNGVTAFLIEIFDESMRLPHWHPNAYELGYLVSGKIEIYLWRYPGEAARFTISPGMCWFIPIGALHSLNNICEHKSEMVVGFSVSTPQNVDLPVAFNGIPVPVRAAYTSPHSQLICWTGTIENPIFGTEPYEHDAEIESPYRIDLSRVSPLFDDHKLGSVVWAVKNNWHILEDISVIRVILKPGTARDPIWYPNAGTLYTVVRGKAAFTVIVPGQEPVPFKVKASDYIFVPIGTLHTFINISHKHDFEVIAFFNKVDPLPEVSLLMATGTFPKRIQEFALTKYAGRLDGHGEPLKDLKYPLTTPYILCD